MIENFFSFSDEEIKGHTWQFWHLAQQNLKEKCFKHKIKLQLIEYELPFELKKKFLNNIEDELKQIQEKYRSYKITTASLSYFNKKTTTVAVLKKNLALKELLYAVKKNQPSTEYKLKVKLAQEVDIYKACIIQKQKEEVLKSKKNILQQEHISAFDLLPIMFHFITKVMCKDQWFKYSPEALSISSGRKCTINQSVFAADGWKSTIIINKGEFTQRSN